MQTAVGRSAHGGRVKACHWGDSCCMGFSTHPKERLVGGGTDSCVACAGDASRSRGRPALGGCVLPLWLYQQGMGKYFGCECPRRAFSPVYTVTTSLPPAQAAKRAVVSRMLTCRVGSVRRERRCCQTRGQASHIWFTDKWEVALHWD